MLFSFDFQQSSESDHLVIATEQSVRTLPGNSVSIPHATQTECPRREPFPFVTDGFHKLIARLCVFPGNTQCVPCVPVYDPFQSVSSRLFRGRRLQEGVIQESQKSWSFEHPRLGLRECFVCFYVGDGLGCRGSAGLLGSSPALGSDPCCTPAWGRGGISCHRLLWLMRLLEWQVHLCHNNFPNF